MKKNTYLIAAGLAAVCILGYFLFNGGGARPVSAQAQKEQELRQKLQAQTQELLDNADRLIQGYYYDDAETLLNEYTAEAGAPEDAKQEVSEKIRAKLQAVEDARDLLVRYDGPVQHIFFHSLIVYPELAFDDKGHPAQGYNMWMTTVKEFKAMLPLLRDKGYVLYGLNDYIAEDPEHPGQVVQRNIYLPEGKIPLVLSIDDVNYYDYMKPDGFANRLVMGNDGRVWTEVITPEGEVIVTRDGDVMPILDDFVAEHPDFSFQGAKGTIALTGYQGALGYRITDDLPQEAEWQQTVKTIADTLRADGWSFACHSYTHNNSWFQGGRATLSQVKYDTDRWKKKIEPWVGETDIYISPFGFQWKNNDPRYRYIIEQGGYKIFCPVGNSRTIRNNGDHIVMPRVNLDGYTMNRRADEVKTWYFDVKDVLDPARPPLIL